VSDIWKMSAVAQAQQIAKGAMSARDATTAALAQVEAQNPHLNAVVDPMGDAALARAAELDEIYATSGPIGPLHGVPVTVKENIDQKDRATPNGVTAFKDLIAPDDAPVVRNLEKAGAIIIGRTNTPEFSFRATTSNELHGRTYSPWNDWATSGGSSGGASTAVMAGMGALAHGNDIGGSLRFPAAAVGAATVKPSLGRVPAWNPSQTAERGTMAQLMSVQGVLAREVKDVRLGMQSLIAYDGHDPWQVPMPWAGPDVPRKVGFTKNMFQYDLHPAVEKSLDTAREALIDAGYEVIEIEVPDIAEISDAAMSVLYGEMVVLMEKDLRKYGSDTINTIFDHYFECYKPLSGDDLIKGMAKRSFWTRQWTLLLQDMPLVLTPFLPTPTPVWNRDEQGLEGVREMLGSGIWSYAMNFMGVPAGIITGNYNDGLPVGVQIVGQRYREDLILDACEAVESRVGIMAQHLFTKIDAAQLS